MLNTGRGRAPHGSSADRKSAPSSPAARRDAILRPMEKHLDGHRVSSLRDPHKGGLGSKITHRRSGRGADRSYNGTQGSAEDAQILGEDPIA